MDDDGSSSALHRAKRGGTLGFGGIYGGGGGGVDEGQHEGRDDYDDYVSYDYHGGGGHGHDDDEGGQVVHDGGFRGVGDGE